MFDTPSYEWTKKEKTFAIQIRSFKNLDGYGWCLYVLVYDNHPYFEKPSELIDIFDFHGGCTYDEKFTMSPARGIRYDWQKECSYLKIGCDYQHYQDNFCEYHPRDGIPFKIEKDAISLSAQMSKLCKVDTQ
jgi:hypothetical protein